MKKPGHDQAQLDGSSEDAVVMRDVTREVILVATHSQRFRLLDGINLRIRKGELLHVVGPSGSGKSSLLRLINRLDEASGGSVMVLGRTIEDWSVRQLRLRVGMVFQEPTLLGLSVRENLDLALRLGMNGATDTERRIERALGLAHLDLDLLERGESQLSVGQKHRVSLARALINEPDVLLLDEPTAALDIRTAERLLRHLEELRERQALTIIMATHRLNEAAQLGGRMLVLIEGRVAALGGVQELTQSPPTRAVRDFLLGSSSDE